MKGRMERLIILPFSAGCVSSSSVSICIQHKRRPKEDTDLSHMVCRSKEGPNNHKDTFGDHMMKGSPRSPTPSKPNMYIGFHRLTRSIKSLSQSLVFKEETDEMEMEMEIGLPTDVKHVTHIGFDGSTTLNANGCNENLVAPNLLSSCPDFMSQYEQQDAFAPMDATCGMHDKSCKSPEINGK